MNNLTLILWVICTIFFAVIIFGAIVILRMRRRFRVMRKDYESLTETLYLLDNPTNAKRLMDSIKELEDGKGTQRNLITE